MLVIRVDHAVTMGGGIMNIKLCGLLGLSEPNSATTRTPPVRLPCGWVKKHSGRLFTERTTREQCKRTFSLTEVAKTVFRDSRRVDDDNQTVDP